MKRAWIVFAALSAGMGSVCGQDDDFDPLGERELLQAAKMVRCAVELIEVPTAFLSAAVAEESQTLPNDEKQWKKARELATKGEAKLLDCIVVQTKPGLPTRVGSNLEKLYATEYDPPPSGPARTLFQWLPAKSKFLAKSFRGRNAKAFRSWSRSATFRHDGYVLFPFHNGDGEGEKEGSCGGEGCLCRFADEAGQDRDGLATRGSGGSLLP